MKRYLYLWHRWLGIGLCLLLALWFGSGLVMLYVGYPKLTPAEHWARLPVLALDDCCVEPDRLLNGLAEPVNSLRLTSIAGQPHYLLNQATQVRAFDARTGQPVAAVDAELALASAAQFAPGVALNYHGLIDEDPWTHTRSLDPDRPLHRLQIADEQRRWLYISSASGAVVRDVTALERGWNWVGAWLHWIYPLRGNWLQPLWHDAVVYLSVAATLLAVLGMVVGLLRWRFSKPYRSGSRSPYPGGFARWHHIGGLLFGLVLVAWIFSGLMSMRPWNLLAGQTAWSQAGYQAGNLQQAAFDLPLPTALARLNANGPPVVELEWRMLGGQSWLIGYAANGQSQIIGLEPEAQARTQLDSNQLLAAAQAGLPGVVWQSEWVERYDLYYVARAEQSMYGHRLRPLPMLRIRFDDAPATWVQLDPHTGAVLDVLDRNRRLARWLFNLLHSWDLPWLLERPRLREAVLIGFSLGGLLISLSGIVLGWRRIRRIARA